MSFLDSWLLFPIGIIEGFFLFAYNLELFNGKFHNNTSFVISWGIMPVFAGAAIQSNTISIETIIFICNCRFCKLYLNYYIKKI